MATRLRHEIDSASNPIRLLKTIDLFRDVPEWSAFGRAGRTILLAGLIVSCAMVLGCSGKSPVADAVAPEPAVLASVAEPIVSVNDLDLTFIGPDSFAALVAFPSRLSERPWSSDPAIRGPLDRFLAAGGEGQVDWTRCERVSVAVSLQGSAGASPSASSSESAMAAPPVIVRTEWKEPMTVEQLVSGAEGFAAQQLDGRSYFVNLEAGVGFWQENESTIWFSSWERLQTLHQRKAPTSRIARVLAAQPLTSDVEMVVDLAAIRQFSEGMNPGAGSSQGENDAMLEAAFEKAKTLVVQVDTSQERFLLATVAIGDEQLAVDLQKWGKKQMQQGFLMLSTVAALSFSRLPEEAGNAATQLLQVVWQGIKLEAVGQDLTVSMTVGESARAPIGTLIDWAVVEQQKAQRLAAFKQVADAIGQYVREKGDIPRDIVSADGTPLLSWRVALLPYLGEQALFDSFKLDEAWDSETNRPLVERMPSAFKSSEATQSSIVALVGEGMAGQTSRTSAVTDAADTTLAFVGVNDARLETWSAPGGLTSFTTSDLKELGDPSVDQLPVITADGVAHMLSRWERQRTIEGMVTADGGEMLDASEIFPPSGNTPSLPAIFGGGQN